jgi:hypothetical protein
LDWQREVAAGGVLKLGPQGQLQPISASSRKISGGTANFSGEWSLGGDRQASVEDVLLEWLCPPTKSLLISLWTTNPTDSCIIVGQRLEFR